MFKVNNKNFNFLSQFCLGSISNRSGYVKVEKVSLKRNLYDSSVNYDAIYRSDMLKIHKYFMVKNDLK